MHYNLHYDGEWIARVRIDDTDKSRDTIREMVEFWSNWKPRLKSANGDYTQCWLKQLTRHLLYHGPRTQDEEGWVALDGSFDITLMSYSPWEFDTDLIEVEAENDAVNES